MDIVILKTAQKHIDVMDQKTKGRIRDGISKIPWGDIKKLSGYQNLYRLRIGDYRIIFEIKDETVIVRDVLPRGQAYKKI